MRAFLSALAVLTIATGCSVSAQGEPARAPAPDMPTDIEMPTTPAGPGLTRVVLAIDRPHAVVEDILEQTTVDETISTHYASGKLNGSAERKVPVCVAPCAVDLAPGMHRLRATWTGEDAGTEVVPVQVVSRSKLVKRAVGTISGSRDAWTAGWMLSALGGAAVLVGAPLSFAPPSDGKEQEGFKTAGTASLVGGLIALAIGVPLAILTQETVHDGTTTEVPLSR